MPRRALAAAAFALLAAPVAAQVAPDFGTDSSAWARDGECDDPRFEGAGMAGGPLLEADRMADATDCAAAFAAGTIGLIDGAAPAPAGVKGGAAPATGAPPPAPVLPAIDYGNDSSEWANDGECDDRRFAGDGMALTLTWAHVGRDATDCRALVEAGGLRAWDWAEARAATRCEALDFGDDAGEHARDGECDDPRFEGPAVAGAVSSADVLHDRSDCLQLCAFGALALRDY